MNWVQEKIKDYYAVWLGIDRAYEEWASARHITSHTLFVLYGVWQNNGHSTQKQICDQWCMPKQTVHTILKSLQERGILEIRPLPTDRRNKEIRFTSSGREFADQILGELFSLEETVMVQMGKAQCEQMIKSGHLFLELFQKNMKKGN